MEWIKNRIKNIQNGNNWNLESSFLVKESFFLSKPKKFGEKVYSLGIGIGIGNR